MLTERNRKILQILYQAPGIVTTHEIAAQLGVSVRTVQYSLRDLEDWANKEKIRLEIKPRLGIYLCDREIAERFLTKESFEENDRFLPGEARVWIEILSILSNTQATRIVALMEVFQASKTTILRDLSKVEEYFEKHSLALVRNRQGIWSPLDEKSRRKEMIQVIRQNFSVDDLAEYIFSSDYTLIGHSGSETQKAIWNYFRMQELKELKECIYSMQEALDTQLSDLSFIDHLLWLLVSIPRIRERNFLKLSQGRQNEFLTECQIVNDALRIVRNKYNIEFEADEILYIASGVASAQKTKATADVNDRYVAEFLDEINAVCKQEFQKGIFEIPEIVQNLKVHLQQALLRAKYGISSYNPLLDKIKTQYPMSFLISQKAAQAFEMLEQIAFTEDELAYIATYIELIIGEPESEGASKVYRAVVICSMGFATSKILSLKIENEFPNIRIIDQLSAALIPKYDFTAIDLVFSTVDVRVMLTKPMLMVNPMLTREDIQKVNEYLAVKSGEQIKKIQYEQILELLKAREKGSDFKNAEKKLREIMGLSAEETSLKSLFQLMPERFCQTKIKASSWEEAVWIAAAPLLKERYIKESYIEEILRVNKEYDNYYLLGETLSMPHAAPSAGVKRIAFSMATLDTPLEILSYTGKTAKVYVILILAAIDTWQHSAALLEISDIFDREDAIKRLINSQSSENLYKVLKEMSGQFLCTE